MLKFHIFLIFNCEELVRIRVICEGLVRVFSDVKNRYSIFTNVKNQYQMFTDVNICTNQMLTDVKTDTQILWPGMIIFKHQSLAPTWHDRFDHFTYYV